MNMHRRALLGALSAGVAASAVASAQEAQAPPAPQPSLADRLTARAMEHRHAVRFDGQRFSGPGYDLMLEEGRASQFFCVGEEHGIAENPKLAAQLFGEFARSGYSKACVEISPPMAAEMDRAARDGMDGLRAMFADPRANVAFFGMREEAEWIASARSAVRGRGQVVWGLDYEVGGFARIVDRLREKRVPAAARAPFAAMVAQVDEMSAQFAQSRSPQHIYSFGGDPTLVRAVRDAWANPDAESDWMLATLEETLTINRYWTTQQGWMSNEARARLNRANFRRYWDAEREKPRVFFKFGASHMVRGVSHTQVLDVGNQVSETAEAMGSKSFHIMVLPGAGTQHARMDIQTWRYAPAAVGTYSDMGMTPLLAAAHTESMTLIDLRPIRPLVSGRRVAEFAPDFVRNVHGFDALLVMTGSTASTNL